MAYGAVAELGRRRGLKILRYGSTFLPLYVGVTWCRSPIYGGIFNVLMANFSQSPVSFLSHIAETEIFPLTFAFNSLTIAHFREKTTLLKN